MKITVQKRLALLTGLLLLALLAFATGIQAAQAAAVAGSGTGSSTASFASTTQPQGLTAAAAHQHHRSQGAVAATAGMTAPVGAQGRGGFDSAHFRPASGVQPAASGTSSTTAWIIAGSAAAVLLIGFAAWALTRRRRQSGEFASAAYCARHPEDARCTAA
jgi:hypothetical protein